MPPPRPSITSSVYTPRLLSAFKPRPARRWTSTTTPKAQIPPESPLYIHVPQPPQQQGYGKRDIKGILPVPRQIFPRSSSSKVSAAYLAAATAEPSSTKDYRSIEQGTRDTVEWKARQAARRRQNLREGLLELHRRKVRSDRQRSGQQRDRQAESQRRANAPEREDDRLTTPSVLRSTRLQARSGTPDPDREARLVRKRENVRQHERRKRDEQLAALHTLYMNARDFIVTEAALSAAVDEAFDDPFYKVNPEHSVWDKEGFPHGISALLGNPTGSSRGMTAVEYHSGPALAIRNRLQRVAEELTGGKL